MSSYGIEELLKEVRDDLRNPATFPGGESGFDQLGFPEQPRGLGVGWQPNYAAEFDLTLNRGSARDLYELIHNWLNSHYRGFNPVACNLNEFVQGKKLADQHDRVSLATETFVGSASQNNPQYWLMTFRHPQRDLKFRTWQTRIGVTRTHEKRYTISISNEHMLRAEFHGEAPELPALSTPRIVRECLDAASRRNLWSITSGNTQLSSEPVKIDHPSMPTLTNAICDLDRKSLLVVLSPLYANHDRDKPRYAISPWKIARKLSGIGTVMALTIHDPQQSLEFMVPKPIDEKILPFGGWGAIFWPKKDEKTDPRTMRIGADKMMDDADRQLRDVHLSALRFAVSRQKLPSDTNGGIVVRTPEDLDRAIRESKLRGLRDRIRVVAADRAPAQAPAPQPDPELEEYIKLLEQDNQEARRDIKELHRVNYDLRSDLEVARANASAEKLRAQELTRIVEEHKHSRALEGEVLEKPTDVFQALEYVEKRYRGNVIVHEDAKKGASEMVARGEPKQSGARNRAISLIEHVASTLWTLKFETQTLDQQTFKQKTGFPLTFGESPQIESNPSLRAHREVRYREQTWYAKAHVKYGNRPGNQIRVHFFFDEGEKKVVIAKVADHLPIASSKGSGDPR